jgi:hypothetical protein
MVTVTGPPKVPDRPFALAKNPRADVELKVRFVAVGLVVEFSQASCNWIVNLEFVTLLAITDAGAAVIDTPVGVPP